QSLRLRGWQVAAVGPTTPDALAALLARRTADAVLAWCSLPLWFDDMSRMVEVAHRAGTRLLASGPAFGPDGERADRLGMDGFAGDARAAGRILYDWRTRRFDARAASARLAGVGARARGEGLQAGKLARLARGLTEDEHYADAVALVVRAAVAVALAGDEDRALAELVPWLRYLLRSGRLHPLRVVEVVRSTTARVVELDGRLAWLTERVERSIRSVASALASGVPSSASEAPARRDAS
ncbi:MAG TPA: hypothetical protein VMD59_00410, partial [Acidimicrobiales bacterium]|nr:hypothetical protein [Acidimicrobiales bacterium]